MIADTNPTIQMMLKNTKKICFVYLNSMGLVDDKRIPDNYDSFLLLQHYTLLTLKLTLHYRTMQKRPQYMR